METPTQTPTPLPPQPLVKPSKAMPTINVTLRFFTFIFLLIAMVIYSVDKGTMVLPDASTVGVRFSDIIAYRYVLSTIVIGLAYTLAQIPFTLYRIITGRYLMTGRSNILFDFYGDKFISYLLATGTAAGFGGTIDLRSALSGLGVGDFFNEAGAAASLVLIAFCFSAGSSIISSYQLSSTY
ncbi:hypothetical protein Nepgr_009778 [Nepenthes gracilis]|uniref:CASP-like protein n=1 Tax=Nepenthes gracilis TaxID=150966 RepID=A0AAD3SB47_NEPGR|nr:hypothetical protein Nepgr_009778 [Nepenthes gracilis]